MSAETFDLEKAAWKYVDGNLDWDTCESNDWDVVAKNTFIAGYAEGRKQERREFAAEIMALYEAEWGPHAETGTLRQIVEKLLKDSGGK